MSFLFRESYVMAPFPEVMLRVGCGWQQFFKNVVSTVPNFRKQSFISIVNKFLDSRFYTIHACDRRTDRRAVRRTELAWHIRAIAYMLSRVKI